jgi:hypothetical protein
MAVDYRLPLKLNTLYLEDRPSPQGTTRQVINAVVYIEWESIGGIEEFVKSGIFPESDNSSRVTVCTKLGNYICKGDVDEFGNDWARYKLWKENRKIFNLN